MGGGYGNMPGGFGGGMMGGGFGSGMFGSGLFASDPLTLDEATTAVESYLNAQGDDNLALKDVMVFDNHAYAQIVEKDSGIGAMEVLVDPVTKSISPEMGPNMMWNQKYGMMAGMMGNFNNAALDGENMPVSPADAVQIAQSYLDTYVPGNLQADEHADPFYGYYTLHLLRDGETVGMLSVNGYNGQVFLHTWHGDLLEMSEE